MPLFVKHHHFLHMSIWPTEDLTSLNIILDRIDANDQLRQELDEIVGGLQGYLSNVKNQGMKRQRDYESVLGEKAILEQKCGKLEQELAILDTEAKRYKEMEKVCFIIITEFLKKLFVLFNIVIRWLIRLFLT